MPKERKKWTTRELREKFEATAFRVSQERNDFFLPQIVDLVKKNQWVSLQPGYQRRLVWDIRKKSLFIESLLLNVPIPPVFLYESELSRYEVMDGQQRLDAIIDFYDNGFPLHGLERWNEINGRRYKELPDTLQRGLDRRRLSATVILIEGASREQTPYLADNDIRKDVFERLNTGGQNLNQQEIRNALYSGPFNDLLIELSEDSLFTKLWEIPSVRDHVDRHGNPDKERAGNPYYRRMGDCEIVLRFFALRKRSRIKGSVRHILDSCMSELQNASPHDIDRMKVEFLARLALAHKVFGDCTFRHRDKEEGKWALSRPLYDAVMVALDRLYADRAAITSAKASVAKRIGRLFRNDAEYALIVGRANTAKAIAARIELLERTIKDSAAL